LRADIWHVLAVDRAVPPPYRRAVPAIRIALNRPAPKPLDLIQPRHGLHDESYAREIRQLPGNDDLLGDDRSAAGERPEPLLVRDDDSTRRPFLAQHHCDVAPAVHGEQRPREIVNAPLPPLRGETDDPVVVRWGAPERQARRAG